MMAASVTRPRSGSAPVWPAFEISIAPRAVRGPGKTGDLPVILESPARSGLRIERELRQRQRL